MKPIEVVVRGGRPAVRKCDTFFELRGGSIKKGWPNRIEGCCTHHPAAEIVDLIRGQRTRAYQRSVHTVNREDKHLRLRLPLTARHSPASAFIA